MLDCPMSSPQMMTMFGFRACAWADPHARRRKNSATTVSRRGAMMCLPDTFTRIQRSGILRRRGWRGNDPVARARRLGQVAGLALRGSRQYYLLTFRWALLVESARGRWSGTEVRTCGLGFSQRLSAPGLWRRPWPGRWGWRTFILR